MQHFWRQEKDILIGGWGQHWKAKSESTGGSGVPGTLWPHFPAADHGEVESINEADGQEARGRLVLTTFL